jgi:hypothetical protein
MEMITLRTFDNYFTANILLARLQDEGINCELKDEYTVTIDPLLSNAIGGIKLAVYQSQVGRAEELLHKYHAENVQNALCPDCKAVAIDEEIRPVNSLLAKIFNKLFKKYEMPLETVYYCKNCNWESRVLPIETQQLNQHEDFSDAETVKNL